jgi:hypothetical protein
MSDERHSGSRWWYVLLVIPLVGLLATPIYARQDPELFGFPFFYWYQFVWVPLSVAITYLVYVRTRARGAPSRDDREPEAGR